jgi:methionine-S-sulfoxide reductase
MHYFKQTKPLIRLFICAKNHTINEESKHMQNNRLKTHKMLLLLLSTTMNVNAETAVFGGGCFWCTDAIFRRVDGVLKTECGYTGGETTNPTYRDVCTGETGHAEVLRITFDNTKISYEQLLDVFFNTHDATTLNRQGADVGTQYRSAIFYTNPHQKELAEQTIAQRNMEIGNTKKIVTQLAPLGKFYVAEDYHQNYFEKNPTQGYCRFVIEPKVKKFYDMYRDK